MGKDSAIEWTDHTFNPWWGCVKVSEACRSCYAETAAHRWGWDVWGPGSHRRFFNDKHWNDPLTWDAAAKKAGKRARVFCASMADVFEEHISLPPQRDRLFRLIERTPNLIWMLLSKRPQNVRTMVPVRWLEDRPPANVWMGYTAETQHDLGTRSDAALNAPMFPWFASVEPLLTSLDLLTVLQRRISPLRWVIVGGESGEGKPRPMSPDWVRQIRADCELTGTPFFFKQWGAWLPLSLNYPGRRDARGVLTIRVDGVDYSGDKVTADDQHLYARMGKDKTGAMLDGRRWLDIPEDMR